MKRFAMIVAFLALGGFVMGCGGEKKKTPETKKAGEKVETKADEKKAEPGPAPEEKKEEKKEDKKEKTE